MESNFTATGYFITSVYSDYKPEFLSTASIVSDEYIDTTIKKYPTDEMDILVQTENFSLDSRVSDLTGYIQQTSQFILDEQGYDLSGLKTDVFEFWCQKHFKYSSHDAHMHGFGSMISGFYFIECPEDSCKLVIYDPRPAKEFGNLPEKDIRNITLASQAVNFGPKPGDIFFINSWLRHSFTRNRSNDAFKMIHFNVGVVPDSNQQKMQLSTIVV